MSAADQPRPHRGLVVRCRRHAVSPSVAIRIWFSGGLLAESRPGLGLASGRMLVEGTPTRSWDRIARESEDLGMDVGGFGGSECTGLRVDTLASDWRTGVRLAADLVINSTFPGDRCRWVREQTLAELESLAEQPEVRAGWTFLDQLYGPHPWGRPLQGSRDSLARLSSEACADFHRSAVAGTIIVSVAGDIDEGEAGAIAASHFAALAEVSAVASKPVPPPASRAELQEVVLPPGDQVHILAGHLTVPVMDPDFVALEVASVLLGSGPGLVGRIPERLREQEGLAYSASAAAAAGAGSQPGRLVVHAATGTARVDAALLAIREELDRFVSEGVGERELEEARQFLLGSDPFHRETARQLATLQAQSVLYGLPFDDSRWLRAMLEELDVERVEAAIRRHLDPRRLVVTLGLPSAA